MTNKKIAIVAGLVLLLGGFVTVVDANHSWGKYHWDISTVESEDNPLVLGNNLTTPEWDSSLAGASVDWNRSVLLNKVVGGDNVACDPVRGQVEVCNSEYGQNGWLGVAQIWAYRGKDGHIAQALVKMNDTYFNQAEYNTPAWRNMVMCQEVGHTYGLDHQDENFDNPNLGTCMDYTNDPGGDIYDQVDNLHPNEHDYEQLEAIYGHLNGIVEDKPKGGNGGGKGKKPNRAGVGVDINLNNPSAWGQAVRTDAQGNNSLYERDLGNGQVLITHVLWVE